MDDPPRLVIGVSSARDNLRRRMAVRKSWFQYVRSPDSPLPEEERGRVGLHFLLACSGGCEMEEEQAAHGDLLLLDAPEGYGALWRKTLTFFQWLESSGAPYDYAMHADDDSFLRMDLLTAMLAPAPRHRFYWGYIWDGTGNRVTHPIRNPHNKSHMPVEQYPLDSYPPFASGCGFILSRDLVQALLAQPLPDYRLLDPPFGIHLCGGPRCIIDPPVVPVHDERVRPYRPLPTFRPDSIVQHYLQPEEMRPFYVQALAAAAEGEAAGSSRHGSSSADTGGDSNGPSVGAQEQQQQHGGGGAPCAVPDDPAEGLYNQLVAMGLLRR